MWPVEYVYLAMGLYWARIAARAQLKLFDWGTYYSELALSSHTVNTHRTLYRHIIEYCIIFALIESVYEGFFSYFVFPAFVLKHKSQ